MSKIYRASVMNWIKLILILFFFLLLISDGLAQETQYVNSIADSVKIAYNEIGEGNKTLVLVHGWACDKTYWNKQIPVLKDQYRIITIDLAGHGESGTSRSKYTVDNYAKDILTVIIHLKLDSIILIGHAMGAGVVLKVGANFLDKTKAVISVDGLRNIPEIKDEKELVNLEKKLRTFWDTKDFESKVYNWVKSWPSPESCSLQIDSMAKDISLNDPYTSIESMVNYWLWYNSEFPDVVTSVEELPIISISSEAKPDEYLYQKKGINFTDITMNNASHFLQICNSKEFNKILLKQLENIK